MQSGAVRWLLTHLTVTDLLSRISLLLTAAHHLGGLETLWPHFCGADPETLDAELPGLLGGWKLMLRALPTPPTPPHGDVEAK